MPVWLLDQAFALLHIHTLTELFYVFNICGSKVTTTILMLIHILIILFVVKTILIIRCIDLVNVDIKLEVMAYIMLAYFY